MNSTEDFYVLLENLNQRLKTQEFGLEKLAQTVAHSLADLAVAKRDAVSEGRRCSCVIDAGCEIHGIRQWSEDRERIHVLEAEIAANQHVKILQDSLADLSASKKDAVSEGCEIPVAVGYRCLDCNYDRVFADLKRLGQADLEIGICPACGEWSIAIVFARPVLI